MNPAVYCNQFVHRPEHNYINLYFMLPMPFRAFLPEYDRFVFSACGGK